MIPAGRFAMGTSAEEAIRLGIAPTNRILPWQQPQHAVHIEKPFALAATPVTRAEYALFAADTGPAIAGSGWDSPGIVQTDRDPVVRVSWRQANAYAEWLTQSGGGGGQAVPPARRSRVGVCRPGRHDDCLLVGGRCRCRPYGVR